MATDPRARKAFARADALSREVLARWPHAWTDMDRMRRDRPTDWPNWCLLPMAAAVAATGAGQWRTGRPPPVGAVAALYAWRYSRSVYLVDEVLMARLLTQVPDAVDIDGLVGLPQWCVYVTAGDPEWPEAGLWIHLEHDVNTGRAELRLLVDEGVGGLDDLLAVPVYLDRTSLTEALADYRETALLTIQRGRVVPGVNVVGAAPDVGSATLADHLDGYVAVAAYLSRPEADIAGDRPGVRPARLRSPARDRTVWRVGGLGGR